MNSAPQPDRVKTKRERRAQKQRRAAVPSTNSNGQAHANGKVTDPEEGCEVSASVRT